MLPTENGNGEKPFALVLMVFANRKREWCTERPPRFWWYV